MKAKLGRNQVSVWALAPRSPVDANRPEGEAKKGAWAHRVAQEVLRQSPLAQAGSPEVNVHSTSAPRSPGGRGLGTESPRVDMH